MKTKKINWFWVAYLLLVAIAIVLLSVSCSTTKSSLPNGASTKEPSISITKSKP